MEVRLDAVEGQVAPQDTYIALRIGEVQKQSRFSNSRTYRFPEPGEGKGSVGRIEVFKRLGYVNIAIDSPNGVFQDVDVPCDFPDFNNIRMKLAVHGAAKNVPPPDKKGRAKERVDAAQKYLLDHRVEEVLAEAMREVIQSKPENPHTFIAGRIPEIAVAKGVCQESALRPKEATVAKDLPRQLRARSADGLKRADPDALKSAMAASLGGKKEALGRDESMTASAQAKSVPLPQKEAFESAPPMPSQAKSVPLRQKEAFDPAPPMPSQAKSVMPTAPEQAMKATSPSISEQTLKPPALPEAGENPFDTLPFQLLPSAGTWYGPRRKKASTREPVVVREAAAQEPVVVREARGKLLTAKKETLEAAVASLGDSVRSQARDVLRGADEETLREAKATAQARHTLASAGTDSLAAAKATHQARQALLEADADALLAAKVASEAYMALTHADEETLKAAKAAGQARQLLLASDADTLRTAKAKSKERPARIPEKVPAFAFQSSVGTWLAPRPVVVQTWTLDEEAVEPKAEEPQAEEFHFRPSVGTWLQAPQPKITQAAPTADEPPPARVLAPAVLAAQPFVRRASVGSWLVPPKDVAEKAPVQPAPPPAAAKAPVAPTPAPEAAKGPVAPTLAPEAAKARDSLMGADAETLKQATATAQAKHTLASAGADNLAAAKAAHQAPAAQALAPAVLSALPFVHRPSVASWRTPLKLSAQVKPAAQRAPVAQTAPAPPAPVAASKAERFDRRPSVISWLTPLRQPRAAAEAPPAPPAAAAAPAPAKAPAPVEALAVAPARTQATFAYRPSVGSWLCPIPPKVEEARPHSPTQGASTIKAVQSDLRTALIKAEMTGKLAASIKETLQLPSVGTWLQVRKAAVSPTAAPVAKQAPAEIAAPPATPAEPYLLRASVGTWLAPRPRMIQGADAPKAPAAVPTATPATEPFALRASVGTWLRAKSSKKAPAAVPAATSAAEPFAHRASVGTWLVAKSSKKARAPVPPTPAPQAAKVPVAAAGPSATKAAPAAEPSVAPLEATVDTHAEQEAQPDILTRTHSELVNMDREVLIDTFQSTLRQKDEEISELRRLLASRKIEA